MGEIQYQASFTMASDLLNNWSIVYHSLVNFFFQPFFFLRLVAGYTRKKKSEIVQ